MSDHTYTPPMQIDMMDLVFVAIIERDTARAIRVNPTDYVRIGHPMVVVDPGGHKMPVEVSSDVPYGTIDAPPPEITKPHAGHLGRLLGRMVAKLRREL